jgi:hypothetical protein
LAVLASVAIAACHSLLPIPFPLLHSTSLFATPYSLFAFFMRRLLARGMWSAGGAWMPATHPDRHAMTGMQTPLSIRSRATPALRSLRTAGKPRRAIDLRKPGEPHPAWVEAPCGPSDGIARLAALHVGFLARARARRYSACPPRSYGNLICRTGHRYPEERVSRTSPARSLTASGTPRPRSAQQVRLRKAPLRSETNAIRS